MITHQDEYQITEILKDSDIEKYDTLKYSEMLLKCRTEKKKYQIHTVLRQDDTINLMMLMVSKKMRI